MKRHLVPLLISAAAVLAACGSGTSTTTADGSSSGGGRAVAIEMRDIAYSPTTLSASKGDTVTFTFTNKGAIVHEALIGDEAAQDAHAMEMETGGVHHGSDRAPLTVQPGKSGTLTYTFDKAGTVIVGCHEPGHYEAGMKVVVTVT